MPETAEQKRDDERTRMMKKKTDGERRSWGSYNLGVNKGGSRRECCKHGKRRRRKIPRSGAKRRIKRLCCFLPHAYDVGVGGLLKGGHTAVPGVKWEAQERCNMHWCQCSWHRRVHSPSFPAMGDTRLIVKISKEKPVCFKA